MNPRFLTRVGVAAAVALTVACAAHAQQPTGTREKTQKGSYPRERASGVITKVERVTKGASNSQPVEPGQKSNLTLRLTINTNDVWRDWARDQAKAKDTGSPKKDAAKGQNSVATKGEPADANSLVVVDLGADTKVETRFRAPDDESSKGKTAEEVARDDGTSRATRSDSAKPVRFRSEDLAPGLYVEVDYRHVSSQNPATTVTVIRPIMAREPSERGKNDRSR